LLADDLVHNLTVRGDQREDQGHLPKGVCGATEARIEVANSGLDSVKHALGNLGALDIVFCYLRDCSVHREIILPRGNDQVNLLDRARALNLVVMEQCAARRLAYPNRVQSVDSRVRAQIVIEDLRIVE